MEPENEVARAPQAWLGPAVFAVAFVALVLDAGGGPAWGTSSVHVVLASRFDHLATSPLYDLLAGVFTLVPAGEPGFRLGVLGALLGACTLAGVIAAARALVPRDPLAGVAGVLVLLVAPPFREAAAFASPGLLAAAGTVWATAFATRYARGASAGSTTAEPRRDARDAAAALAACVLVIGSAPWLGGVLAAVIAGWLSRARAPRGLVAAGIAGLGLAIVALWLGAIGSLPGLASPIGTGLVAAGRGAAAIAIGAGLVGVGFGALTRLAHARWLAALIAVAAAHELLVGGAAPALLGLAAIAVAIIPGALVRVIAPHATGITRHVVTLAAGVPLVGVAAISGATLAVDDPGAAPVELAHDLVDGIPPGAGVYVATHRTMWLALHHEITVAGARPDLALVPPLPAEQADAIVASALRSERVVGADVAAFGRLDVRRALPRGRGFQLVGDIPPAPTVVHGPAHYASAIGAEQSIVLALERARFEGAGGRLDAAARAAGLEQRFGAADLAILGATVPSAARPALFGFLPLGGVATGPWLLDTFGDDLAWVAGLESGALPSDAPMPRKLHARWRAILEGKATPDDPEIAALGEAAVRATKAMFTKREDTD